MVDVRCARRGTDAANELVKYMTEDIDAVRTTPPRRAKPIKRCAPSWNTPIPFAHPPERAGATVTIRTGATRSQLHPGNVGPGLGDPEHEQREVGLEPRLGQPPERRQPDDGPDGGRGLRLRDSRLAAWGLHWAVGW